MNATEATAEANDSLPLLRFTLFLSAFYAILILFLYYLGNCWLERERAKLLSNFDLG
jgi:hypothetical protein